MALTIPDTITEDELLQIVNDETVRKKKRNRAIYILAFYQALRISEVMKLNPEDYDPNTKLIHIRKSKRAKDRRIPINPKVVRILKFLPLRTDSKDKGIRAIQYALKKDGKRILKKDLHPHTLRHSGATYYLNKKVFDTKQLQIFLGHADARTTNIYTHVNPSDLTKIMWDEEERGK